MNLKGDNSPPCQSANLLYEVLDSHTTGKTKTASFLKCKRKALPYQTLLLPRNKNTIKFIKDPYATHRQNFMFQISYFNIRNRYTMYK
jgi:hypothetical protein